MRIDEPAVEDRPDAPVWGVDEPTMARWPELAPGTELTIVKRSAKDGGREHARYPGTVIASDLPSPWVVFESHWTYGTVAQAGLTFEIGDILHEIFSPIHPYNAFAVFRPSGELKGWYANVDWPAVLEREGDATILVWNDLFIDVVALPDGSVMVLDEDELAESGLAATDPTLHDRILAASDELVSRFHARRPPFEALTRLETNADP
jgi:hypothetical protein